MRRAKAFEIGTWKTHLRRLTHPLTGSTTWVEYDGTTTVRKVWDGRANLLELEVDGPKGHIEAREAQQSYAGVKELVLTAVVFRERLAVELVDQGEELGIARRLGELSRNDPIEGHLLRLQVELADGAQ